jgi:hypothetical protein
MELQTAGIICRSRDRRTVYELIAVLS